MFGVRYILDFHTFATIPPLTACVPYSTKPDKLILVPALAVLHAGLIALTRYQGRNARFALWFDSQASQSSPVPAAPQTSGWPPARLQGPRPTAPKFNQRKTSDRTRCEVTSEYGTNRVHLSLMSVLVECSENRYAGQDKPAESRSQKALAAMARRRYQRPAVKQVGSGATARWIIRFR